MSDLLDRLPYARFLGLTTASEGQSLTVTMPFDVKLVGNPVLPALHGGSTAAMLERAKRERDAALEVNGRTPIMLGASRLLEEATKEIEELKARLFDVEAGKVARSNVAAHNVLDAVYEALGGMGAENVLDAARRVVKERDEARRASDPELRAS